MARLIRAMASARLAAWSIAIQVGFLIVSFLVPQRGIFPDEQVDSFLDSVPGAIAWIVETLALDHVFTSGLYYAAALVLAVNLIVCTWQRAARRTRRRASGGAGAIPASAIELPVSDADAVSSALTALGVQGTETGEGESRYYLRRGDLGFTGSVVMHAALVLVLVGGVATGLTTFRGEMLFTEGQTHLDTPEDYLAVTEVPEVGGAFGDFSVTLDDMAFTYEGGSVVDAVAVLTVTDSGGTRQEEARVNYPLKVQGKSFLLQDAGHSVWLTVTGPDGAPVLDSFVNLLNVTDAGYTDSLDLPGGEFRVLSRPDASSPPGERMTEGLRLVSPVVGVSMSGLGVPEDPVWIEPGAAVTLGGYTVRVNEVRIWNRFMVRADDGRYVMYIAFALIIAGTLVRFADPDRWLKAALVEGADGTRLYLWGAVRYRPDTLPKEADLMRRLASAGTGSLISGCEGDDTEKSAEGGSS